MHHYLKFMKHIIHLVVYVYMYIYALDIVCINICFCFMGLRSDSTFPKNFEKGPSFDNGLKLALQDSVGVPPA